MAAFAAYLAVRVTAFPFVGAFWVEFLEGGEIIIGVVFAGVDFGNGGVGCETFGANSEAINVGGHLRVFVALGCCAWFGRGGWWASIVNGLGFEVEFLKTALGEHVYMSADERLYVFIGVGGLG